MNVSTCLASTLTALLLATALPAAHAGCRIKNETNLDFTVTSGNTSNQRVTPNSSTSIAAGKIVGKSKDGKSKDGKTIGGSCKDGDSLLIKNEGGVPVLMQK